LPFPSATVQTGTSSPESTADFVAVQVKTSNCVQNDRWLVSLCTRGGNRSWSGIVKRMDASRCDYVFAHVGDGRRWFVPIESVDGGTAICLGGPKYSEFEVEPGDALPSSGLGVAV
jgi:hypothetical protein